MYWKDAAERIKRNIPCKSYLKKSKHGNYICPFCHSGEGPNQTGALKLYEETNTVFCFVCNKKADAIELHQNQTGESFRSTIEALAPQAGITEPIQWDGAPAARRTAGANSTICAIGAI